MEDIRVDAAGERFGRLAKFGVNPAQAVVLQEYTSAVGLMSERYQDFPSSPLSVTNNGCDSSMPSTAVQFCCSIRCRSASVITIPCSRQHPLQEWQDQFWIVGSSREKWDT